MKEEQLSPQSNLPKINSISCECRVSCLSGSLLLWDIKLTKVFREHLGDLADLYEASDTGTNRAQPVRSPQGERRDGRMDTAYKIPMLMAMPTPTFSFFFICRPRMNCQGSKARAMSEQAE